MNTCFFCVVLSAASNLCLLQTSFLESRDTRLDANGSRDSAGMTEDDAELLLDMEIEAIARGALPLIDTRSSTRISRVSGKKFSLQSSESPRVLVVGTHHKTGTILMTRLLQALKLSLKDAEQKVLYHRELNSANGYQFDDTDALQARGWANGTGIQIIQYQNAINDDFAELERLFGVDGFRYVQIARDPVSLVISAYLYHMQSNDCHNACPKDKLLMRTSPLVDGLKMQADAEMTSTLQEQREVSELICTRASSNYKIMLLSDFAENYDEAVDELYTFLAGDVAAEDVLVDAKTRAVAHDVSRWSSAQQSSSKHVHTGPKKEEVVALWSDLNDEQLDPERAHVNQEREDFLGILGSCGASNRDIAK